MSKFQIGSLADNQKFKSLLNQADEEIKAKLSDTNKAAEVEIVVEYRAQLPNE